MKDVKAMIVIDSRINDDVFHQEYEGFYRTAQETSFGGKEEKTHMAILVGVWFAVLLVLSGLLMKKSI